MNAFKLRGSRLLNRKGAPGILPLAVPWLQYPAGHHCLGIQFAGALVGPQQVGVGADVVVEEGSDRRGPRAGPGSWHR